MAHNRETRRARTRRIPSRFILTWPAAIALVFFCALANNLSAQQTYPVQSITIEISTLDHKDAGTNDPVFLSVGGREFALNQPGDTFRKTANERFRLGTNANIDNPKKNDPRSHQMLCGDVLKAPAYLRKMGSRNFEGDGWYIGTFSVEIDCGQARKLTCKPYVSTLDLKEQRKEGTTTSWRIYNGIWLDDEFGLTLNLECRQSHDWGYEIK